MEVTYIVGHGSAERIQPTTALTHRVLVIDIWGNATVSIEAPHAPAVDGKIVHQLSAAEMRFIVREYRREMRRRFWARLVGRGQSD